MKHSFTFNNTGSEEWTASWLPIIAVLLILFQDILHHRLPNTALCLVSTQDNTDMTMRSLDVYRWLWLQFPISPILYTIFIFLWQRKTQSISLLLSWMEQGRWERSRNDQCRDLLTNYLVCILLSVFRVSYGQSAFRHLIEKRHKHSEKS